MSQQKYLDLPAGNYLPLVVMSDSNGLPVSAPSGSNRVDITSSTSDTLIVAANQYRKGILIDNESTATLYLLFASGVASTSNYSVRVPAGANINLGSSFYLGVIRAVWASANGFARVTEFV